MTKQADIKEGLLGKIKSIRAWRTSSNDPLTAEDDTDDIIKWLHSQGVVLEIDRELPAGLFMNRGWVCECGRMINFWLKKEEAQAIMDLAVEPLMEDESDRGKDKESR